MKFAGIVAVGIVFLWSGPSARGAAVGFAAKPQVQRQAGGEVKIRFTLSGPTDVEVAVLSAQGEVVRHLAAGVLGGKNPPPEPLKAGLAQELTWDGKDDFGKAAAAEAGPLKVRVRAGMGVAFDGLIGSSAYALNRIRGMAVDKDGNLYILEQSYDGHFPGPYDVRVFDRTGKYLRTLMPFPANMKKPDVGGFQLIDAPGEFLVPRNHYSVWPCLIPIDPLEGLKLSPRLAPDGRLLLHDERFSRLFRIRSTDGAVPGAFGELIWPKTTKLPYYDRGGSPVLGLAPDGKTIYATGLAAAAPKGEKLNANWPDGRVCKFSLDNLGGGASPFVTIELPDKRAALEGGWTPRAGSSWPTTPGGRCISLTPRARNWPWSSCPVLIKSSWMTSPARFTSCRARRPAEGGPRPWPSSPSSRWGPNLLPYLLSASEIPPRSWPATSPARRQSCGSPAPGRTPACCESRTSVRN